MAVLGLALVLAAPLQGPLLGPLQDPEPAESRPPTWDDFPVFVWREAHGGKPLPEALFAPFGGTNIERAEDAAWVRERGGTFYVGHAPGRNELHLRREGKTLELWKRWYETRDESLLVRVPCLTDPATRTALFAQLEKSLAARDGDHGLGISLGDEVSLTPWGDPADVCRSETCEASWNTWCAEQGLDAAPAPTTDEARVSFADGNTELLGPWLARRRFHQDVVVELLEELAARARELAPGVPVGLLGMSGQTAFGGVAVDRALSFLDFVEPYRVDDARELAATLLAPGQRRLTTVFPEEGGPAAGVWQLWDHMLRGGDGAVLWSDRELGDEALRDALAGAVARIRDVRERLGAWRPRPRGVAVVHSPDSVALAWLKDALLDGPTWPNRLAKYQRDNGTRERSLRAWLLLLEDAGFLPGALPLRDVRSETATRFELLVLSHVSVVEMSEVRGLVEYVAAGGQVVIEGELARFDASGRPFEDLRKVLEEAGDGARARVHSAPDRLVDYPDLRKLPVRGWHTNRIDHMQQIVREWIDARHRPPFVVRDRKRWLRIFEETDDGWLCGTIPSAPTAESRADLPAEPPGIVFPSHTRVEWIHPPPQGTEGEPRDFVPGEAIFFRLVRE